MGSPGQEEGQKKKAEALEEKKPQGVDPEAPPPQPRVSLRAPPLSGGVPAGGSFGCAPPGGG
jgi:hypothetical protein